MGTARRAPTSFLVKIPQRPPGSLAYVTQADPRSCFDSLGRDDETVVLDPKTEFSRTQIASVRRAIDRQRLTEFPGAVDQITI